MNYTIVAMDVGEFAEACRALGRVVEERATKVGAESVDTDVLDRLVDAATRAPHNETDSVVPSPNEGQNLLRFLGTCAATRIAGETARSPGGLPRGLSCRRRWPDGGRGDGFGTLARGHEGGGGYLLRARQLWAEG